MTSSNGKKLEATKTAKRLRFLIEQKGISRKKLLEHVNRDTLWLHLNGRREPGLESSREYAKAFGMTLDDFDKYLSE